jgi:DNA-3-methyladenine glycosylase II
MQAITEQLIDGDRAEEIQRQLFRSLGPRWAGLRDVPPAALVATQAPARLEACGLHAKRAIAMRRAARVDLFAPDWRARLLAIPEIGTWTAEMVALHGLGHLHEVPAADLGYLKLVGRYLTGRPRAVATEAEVREFFAPYDGWAGLAGEYLRLTRPRPVRRPGGTRWSAAPTPTALA